MTRALLLLLLLTAPAAAVSDPGELMVNPQQETRAETLGKEFRCLVCQNESVEDSDADLAKDLRRLIRENISAGKTDTEITAYLTSRYGDFVKLEPPFGWKTIALWGSPLLALAIGAGLIFRARVPITTESLSTAERARLSEL